MTLVDLNSVETEDSREIGAEWLCKQAVGQRGLEDFLTEQGWKPDYTDKAMIHLISRCVFCASEHKTAQWIQDNSTVAELLGMESHKINRHQRYDISEKFYKLKDALESFLSTTTNELFDRKQWLTIR